jgi:peptidoglycan-N-acetylglucosamine deacetylase
MDKNQIIVTTSWDDGYALDIRIAELLEKYNIEGTFYVPIRNSEHKVMESNILTEISKKHEIGGHTVNHIYLNTLGESEANNEITECRNMLQDKLGKNIDAFCYPGGKYSERDIKLVKEAGFLFGRTTEFFHTELKPVDNIMHTSMQVFNHSSVVLIRHCLKNTFLTPIFNYRFFYKGNRNFSALADMVLLNLVKSGGVFHLWGHSWEIEKYGLWKEFESVLTVLSAHKEISYMNNTEYWQFLNNK